MSNLIEARDVWVTYQTAKGELLVLNDVNLTVKRGEFITVVGPSGCGKSTLLRLILGSQSPDSGTIMLDGMKIQRVNRDVGIVYQNYSLFPHLTVLENVVFGPLLRYTGLFQRSWSKPCIAAVELASGVNYSGLGEERALSRYALFNKFAEWRRLAGHRLLSLNKTWRTLSDASDTARALLNSCGLDPKRDGNKYPFELSGGMRQRAAIAQALIMRPKILLMDEPFGALDARTRYSMQDFIHEQWREQGMTIFFVTHDLPEACKLGTRLICLSQYWKHDEGQPGRGAKIIIDRAGEGGNIAPSQIEETEEFAELTSSINRRGLTPANLQKVSEFELTHENAWRGVST